MLQDALGRWSGVNVVDESEVKEALARRGSSPLTGSDARGIAIASRAALLIRGEISRVGDSLRLHAVVRATANGTVLADGGVVKLSLNLARADSAFASLAERLLFGEEARKDRLEDERGTRSYLARKAVAQGFGAVDQWDLAAADSTFVTATRHDPDYPHALFWVAQVRYWNDAPLASWRASAQRAALRRDRLSGRERTLLDALLAVANGDIADACRQWDRATAGQANDFSAWYGLATCLARDSIVLRDAKSPTGWRFRSSYYRATKAYERAFQQLPPIYKALSAGSYAAVRKVLMTSGSFARPGRALAPDTTTFAAYPSWQGDTLSFFPLPQQDFHGPAVVPEGMQLALHQERELFHDLATSWVSDYPRSLEAMEALALSLEMLGDPGAIDTMKRARALSSTPEDSVNAAITEVWMRVKFSAPRDLAGLSTARALADSLLLGGSPAGVHDPVLLSSLAALTGRARLAASLSRQPAAVAEWGVPPPLVQTALPLLAFASLGGPVDSLRDLEEQVGTAIAEHLLVSKQQRARMQWLGRPAALAFPDYRFKSLSQLAGAGNNVVDMEAAFLRGDTNLVRHAFAELRASRRFLSPSDLTPDALYPETWLLAQLGDPKAASAWIDPTLRALSATAPETFTNPANAGALVQAMALRADLASQAGDLEVAKRWAAAVVVLWGSADPFLQVRVRRMAALAAGLSQAR